MNSYVRLAVFVMAVGSAGSPLADIGAAPPTVLVDTNGTAFDMATLKGKVVVVSFVYTTCNGACPATTSALVRLQKTLQRAKLWGRSVEFVSVTLDPRRDTPDVLKRYAENFGADLASWHFLTGSLPRVESVIAAWGMWARIGASGVLDHPSRVFLVDPRGRQREIYNLEFFDVDTVIHDINGLLAETRKS